MGGWPRPALLLLGLLAGACGLALLAYCCVRFDQRRRRDPGFKRRLREKRRKEREQAKEREKELREQKDMAKVQEFFLQEIQLGELWLGQGEYRKAIEHLAQALAVCTHPTEFMQILEQTLPPQIFEMLVHRIPHVTQGLERALNEQDPPVE
ncbi:TOMM20-like protein 1 [Sphaerodactylus townsendi]|uniref:TOMM20-like protein 1 n=1 Tax=Sphaerodactylus townsendi TaxID=933632 RepID=UPI0020276ACE|nr:TOMM20-like protein 1 [Sphaerodactylus townsendi]